MPEQISKYPEVTLEVLKGAGARCGEGAEQKILTRCPPERFCSLPTGEVCVYGIEQIPQMTQISRQELARVVDPGLWSFEVATLGAIFILGLLIGRFWGKSKRVEA